MNQEKNPSREEFLADLLMEDRRFIAPAAFREQAVVKDASVYEKAQADPDAYWEA